jgi:hypothetical protein
MGKNPIKRLKVTILILGEVDSLLKPAVEKLKKAEEELARIDKLRSEELAKLDKKRSEALKRKNEEKAEVDALEKWKVRIIEKTGWFFK